jgi:anti-anti-sigma factor
MNASPVTHADENGVHVVAFACDANGSANQDFVRGFFANDFTKSVAKYHWLVVDLSGVISLDSASLGPMVQKLRDVQEHKGKLALAGVASAALREIFALTRFDRVFAIYPTRKEAVAAVQAAKAKGG